MVIMELRFFVWNASLQCSYSIKVGSIMAWNRLFTLHRHAPQVKEEATKETEFCYGGGAHCTKAALFYNKAFLLPSSQLVASTWWWGENSKNCLIKHWNFMLQVIPRALFMLYITATRSLSALERYFYLIFFSPECITMLFPISRKYINFQAPCLLDAKDIAIKSNKCTFSCQ